MLELKHISKAFKNKKVLVDINLSFEDHGFVAITGESGSGKTTLINIMSGIEAADSGELLLNGESISFENERERMKSVLKQVAYMPQRQILLNDKTVYENLKEILNLYHIDDESQINLVLKQVRLNEKYKNRIVSTLSTGEAQRVCLAVSLLKKANILVLDEATENLDEANREYILSILKELSKEKLVVLITHDTYNARKYVDRMITISNREVYSDEEILNDIVPIQEVSTDEEVVGEKRKRISLSFTNLIIYTLIPLIFLFSIAMISIRISPTLYDMDDYPDGYYRIVQEERRHLTEDEFRMIYEEKNTYFIFNEDLVAPRGLAFTDYDFNYNTSKRITSYNEVIVSDTFLESSYKEFSEGYTIIETIHESRPLIILNYDLVLEHYLNNEPKSVEAVYKLYEEGFFLFTMVLSTDPKKTLALDLSIEQGIEYEKKFMIKQNALEFNFGITVCSIMLALCITLYIVFVYKRTSFYYRMVAFYKVCGQTNLEIRKKLKAKLYLGPLGFIVLICGIIHLLVYLVFNIVEYDIYIFRFDLTTYLVSLGISLCLLILLNEMKNYIILKTKLKKLIKAR